MLKEIKAKIDAAITAAGIRVWYGTIKEPVFKRPARGPAHDASSEEPLPPVDRE